MRRTLMGPYAAGVGRWKFGLSHILFERMRIPYVIRQSRFIPRVCAAIEAAGGQVTLDHPVHVHFEEEADGYAGEVLVEVDSSDARCFGTDWDGEDASRFPARIRAAATALRDKRCFGRFLVQHHAGQLFLIRN